MLARYYVLLCIAVLAAAVTAEARQSLTLHTLTGTVSDTAGRKLSGVTVDLSRPGEASTVRTVVTDSSGRYRIDRVLPGEYVLVVRLAGFSSAIRDIEIGGGSDTFEYDVTLAPAPASTQGAPVPQLPAKRVICGMTVITPPAGFDRGIQAPRTRPPDAAPVKPTMRVIQPTLCWEPSTDSPPVQPKP